MPAEDPGRRHRVGAQGEDGENELTRESEGGERERERERDKVRVRRPNPLSRRGLLPRFPPTHSLLPPFLPSFLPFSFSFSFSFSLCFISQETIAAHTHGVLTASRQKLFFAGKVVQERSERCVSLRCASLR